MVKHGVDTAVRCPSRAMQLLPGAYRSVSHLHCKFDEEHSVSSQTLHVTAKRALKLAGAQMVICPTTLLLHKCCAYAVLRTIVKDVPVMQDTPVSRYSIIVANMIRLFFPIWFSYLLIQVAFRIGVKRRDRCAASLALSLYHILSAINL